MSPGIEAYLLRQLGGGRFLLVTEPAGIESLMRAAGRPAATLTIPPPAAPPSDRAPLVAASAEYGIEILGPPGIPS